MRTLYVIGTSKKDVNQRLANGHTLWGKHYVLSSTWNVPSNHWNDGDVIKVYNRTIGGSPYAKAYGTVKKVNGKTTVK